MRHRWLLVLLAVGIALGATVGWYGGAGKAQAVSDQELFQVIDSWLREHNVQKPDLPKRVIEVRRLPSGRYLVQCEMYVGKAWFEVWKDGSNWQVRGAPPPS